MSDMEVAEPAPPIPPRRYTSPPRMLATIAVIFLVVFLFVRVGFVEPFGVPTGSMAPTLIGNHREAPCPRCSHPVRVGIPVGGQSGAGIRPYLVGGVGYIGSRQDASPGFAALNSNDFGFDIGGGVMGFFADHVGLRGDLRYFRAVASDLFDNDADPELRLSNLDFWRASIGLVIR